MIVTPDNCKLIGDGLDHPESVCVDAAGVVFAGGEAGQLYRIDGASQQIVASTGGFLLGITLDADGAIHVCDCGRQAVFRIDRNGEVRQRSDGTPERHFQVPNHGVFDAHGNLFVSDSGDYWDPRGTGCIFKISPDDTTTIFHAGPFRFANGVAIDPTGQWLYVAQSTAANIVRIPLAEPNGPIEVTHVLPAGTVPDGMSFSPDGRLLIGCYKPDAVLLGDRDGNVSVLIEDPTGELLNRPTNVTVHDSRLYVSNVGGWHITTVACESL